MPVPKRKRSRQRRDKRFANKSIAVKPMSGCAQCKAPVQGHHVCTECGFYKGRKVIATKADKRVRQAEAAAQKKSAAAPADE